MDTIRVLRILEYVGPRDKVEDTLKRCNVPINGSRGYGDCGVTIHSVILEGFAEVISPIKTCEGNTDEISKSNPK